MNTLPEDIKSCWLRVIRRLESVSKSEGISILTIVVAVDKDGCPFAWSSPRQVKLEPKAAADDIMALLTQSG